MYLSKFRLKNNFQQFKYIGHFSSFRKICHTTEKEKCLTQNAETVEMIVKYHSNQKKTDLFIAEIASKTTNKIRNTVLSKFQNSFIL